MIDAEVIRLRRLRDVALRVRGVARAMGSAAPHDESIFSRSAVICWRIASIATGRLRAHPYRSFQRGPSAVRGLLQSIAALATSSTARRQGKTLQRLASELQFMSRELDDARALTWSPDLSDTLGRAQIQLKRVSESVSADARREAGAGIEASATAVLAPEEPGGSWPYLAI